MAAATPHAMLLPSPRMRRQRMRWCSCNFISSRSGRRSPASCRSAASSSESPARTTCETCGIGLQRVRAQATWDAAEEARTAIIGRMEPAAEEERARTAAGEVDVADRGGSRVCPRTATADSGSNREQRAMQQRAQRLDHPAPDERLGA